MGGRCPPELQHHRDARPRGTHPASLRRDRLSANGRGPHLGPAVGAEAIRVPPNIEASPYADHDRLLPGCAAVVTHGGLGTTLRSLAHGTPLLLLPLGCDQQFNAGRVVELGAGICLPVEASPGEIASALVELLAQPRFKKAADLAAAAIEADRPDESAIEALLGLVPLAR
jgi:UDP:flavonoid glycosyltransferase YjiC (YdhE family)